MSTSRSPKDATQALNALTKRVSDLEKQLQLQDNPRDDMSFVLYGAIFVSQSPIWPVFPRRKIWRVSVRLHTPDSTLSLGIFVDGNNEKMIDMSGRTTLDVPTAIYCPSGSDAWIEVLDCTGDGTTMTAVARW